MTNETQPEKNSSPTKEQKTTKRPRPRGTGAIFSKPNSRYLYIGYTGPTGKYIKESTGTEKRSEAQRFLKKRLEAVSAGNFLGPEIERITVDELYKDLLQDYENEDQAVYWAESVWRVHLKDYFGGMRAALVGTTQLGGNVQKRKGEGAKKATINRELALLRRAFSIAFDAEPQKVVRVPKFHNHIVSEKGNERRGFVEEPQYRKLMDAAGPLWLRGLMAIAYNFGLRRGELLGNPKKGTKPMRCSQVGLLNNTVTLYSGETKNDEGRIVALTEECLMLLTELRRGKQPEDYLFTRENGEVVKDFRGTWDALTEAAGVPGLLFHDFRSSSARNMIRRGVPQKMARTVSGHKTDSVFEHYNIVSEDDIRDAARRIEEGAKAAAANVIPTSFPLAPNQGNERVVSKDRKPS